MSDLLVDDTEVFQDVIHAALPQPLTGEGLSKAVNPHTVLYIHASLQVKTAGLLDSGDPQQI